MNIDWGAARFFLDVIVLVGVVAIGIYTWWVQRGQATKEAISQIDERVVVVEASVKQFERELRHIPTQSDIVALSENIANVHGDLREIKGALGGLSRAVDLMNEYLISRGGKN
jgi:hypothetical protein